jgi:hypothetical protein
MHCDHCCVRIALAMPDEERALQVVDAVRRRMGSSRAARIRRRIERAILGPKQD